MATEDQKFTNVELSFTAKGLRDTDGIGNKSDPKLIVEMKNLGQWSEVFETETVSDNLNPEFKEKGNVPFQFQDIQPIRFTLWDMDNHGKKRGELLGRAETRLAQLVSKGSMDLELDDGNPKHKGKCGTVSVLAEELSNCKDLLIMHLRGQKLPKKDGIGFLGSSDPYVRFVRRVGDSGKAVLVHKTKVRKSTVNPDWGTVAVSVDKLCKGDYETTIHLECWDWDRASAHDYMCEGELRMSSLKQGGKHSIEIEMMDKSGKKPKKAGKLILDYEIRHSYSFVDYLQKGLNVNAGIFLDFTASNGDDIRDPTSLHYLDPKTLNQYQQGIMGMGPVLAQYDTDGRIPVFGFGAKVGGKVSHCFPLNPDEPEAKGVEGVMENYNRFLNRVRDNEVRMYGPTYFRQIVEVAAGYAAPGGPFSKKKSDNYFVWIIMTDGEVMDLQPTIEEICKASKLPLSFVILGIGEGETTKDNGWETMEFLDSDSQPLQTEDGKYRADRDIVQFVEAEQYKHNPTVLYQKVLEEIPGQVEQYMRDNNIMPGA